MLNEHLKVVFYIQQLYEITLMNFSNATKLRIFDCRGIDPNQQNGQNQCASLEEDLIKTIGGHIKEEYKVKVII